MRLKRLIPIVVTVCLSFVLMVLAQSVSGTLVKRCGTGPHDIFDPSEPRDITLKLENKGECKIRVEIPTDELDPTVLLDLGDSKVLDVDQATDIKVICEVSSECECSLDYTISYRDHDDP